MWGIGCLRYQKSVLETPGDLPGASCLGTVGIALMDCHADQSGWRWQVRLCVLDMDDLRRPALLLLTVLF